MHHSEERQAPLKSSLADYLGMAFAYPIDAALGLFFTASSPAETNHSSLTTEDIEQTVARAPEFFQKLDQILGEIHHRFLDPKFITADKFKQNQQYYFIQHFNNQKDTVVEAPNYANAFETVLTNHLREKSSVKTPHNTVGTKENTPTASKINTSLAYLWKTCDKKTGSNDLTRFFNEMSDAHGLIQVTGWSTQNENSLLAIFDYHNYMRYRKDVAEARSIVLSLIAPFYPLFTEYQDIAHREKNIVLKVLRTALPMLITAGFIISMTALIPVALPELAFVILAIPLIYLGLAVASLYVKTKELMYQGYRHLMYQGDLNQFPEFQPNDRLKTIFGAKMAEKIRADYVQAIQACDKREHDYNQKELFTPEDEKNREANLEERNTRILEWFDLRDNTKLNVNQIFCIALERPTQQLKTAQAQDNLDIKNLARTMAHHLDAALKIDATQNNHRGIHAASKLRFFPSCLDHRDEIVALQAREEQISANSQNMNA